jgi:hypothetical protein
MHRALAISLLLLTLCISCGAAYGQQFVAEHNHLQFQGSGASHSFSIGSVAAGHSLAVYLWWFSPTATLASVTACGDTLTLANNPTTNTQEGARSAGAYIITSTGGTCTLTATFSADVESNILEHEVSGIGAFGGSGINPQGNLGTGATATSPTITTTVSGDYIFGATSNVGTTTSPGTGFTSRYSDSNLSSEDKIQATAGSIAATFTNQGSWSYFNTMVIALQPTQGQGGGPLWSGIIDPKRAERWDLNAGLGTGNSGNIPNRSTLCSTQPTLQAGSTSTIAASNGTAIRGAILACSNSPGVLSSSGAVVSIPRGTWHVDYIDFGAANNVTLRGAGPDQTKMFITVGSGCNGLGAGICVMNADNNFSGDPHNVASWSAGYVQGATSIQLSNVTTGSISTLQPGSLLILDQTDNTSVPDEDIYLCGTPAPCSWQGNTASGRSGRAQGQIVTVTSVGGSGPWTIGISPGLYAPNWATNGKSPGTWWSSKLPAIGDGIENISFDLTALGGTGAGIMFSNTTQCWVKNIRSVNLFVHKHIWAYQTSHLVVVNSYFYGGTGTSENYGVDCGSLSTDCLVMNNIFQHLASALMAEGGIGHAFAYNLATDNYYIADPLWQQSDAYHHAAGDYYDLWEGNQGIAFTADDIHGPSFMLTAFRNYWSGLDPAGGSPSGKTENTLPIQAMSYSRHLNFIGNVLGTSGHHANYEVYASSTTDPGNANTSRTSIYVLGYSGSEGTYNATCTNSTPCPNDVSSDGRHNWVRDTMMRWGNYDVATNSVRFVSSEVPSSLTCSPSPCSTYTNPVPANQNLPASFFLPSRPSFFTTTWGTPPWPLTGPDVNNGNIGGVGGHANNIPAKLCYTNTSLDSFYNPNGGTPFTVTGATWNGSSTATLTVGTNSFSAGQVIVVVGVNSGTGAAGYNGTFIVTTATSSTVSYALSANPGTYTSGGKVSYPAVLAFNASNCYPN